VAINLSAAKRQKQSEKQRLRNKIIKSRIKTCLKKVSEAVAGNNAEIALKHFEEFKSLIDRAVTKGVFHKNNAARKKSRMFHRIKKFSQSSQVK